jgi:hypothetical protein
LPMISSPYARLLVNRIETEFGYGNTGLDTTFVGCGSPGGTCSIAAWQGGRHGGGFRERSVGKPVWGNRFGQLPVAGHRNSGDLVFSHQHGADLFLAAKRQASRGYGKTACSSSDSTGTGDYPARWPGACFTASDCSSAGGRAVRACLESRGNTQIRIFRTGSCWT